MAEAEVNHYLERARTVKNVGERGELKVKAQRYLRHRERREREDELKSINERLHPANFAGAALSADGRQTLVRRRLNLEKDLRENSPPTDLTAETKNATLKRERELAELIREGMPSAETMRRNPPGAVDQHRKWEKRVKPYVLEWKNLRVLNNPDDDSQDLANVEMLRPSILPNGPSTFMPDAQIPGAMTYGHVPDENWISTFGSTVAPGSPYAKADADEALKRERIEKQKASALANYEKKAAAELRKLEAKNRMKAMWENMTPEEKAKKKEATSARMKDFWAKKKGAAKAE